MKLDVAGLCFDYASQPVLDNVDFQVHGGELLAILGPNGVGKTTLLKCINALHRPSSGSILVSGRDVLALSPQDIARTVGYVAQRTETARLTVYDAVLMGRKPHIRWRVETRDMKMVEAVLRRTGLADLSLRFIDELSGGELQKVALARTLVQEPRLMLLDEPTSALDLKNQVGILHLLRRVVDEHDIAAVMTMHDLNTALRYADRFIFLKDGRIHACGATDEVTAPMVSEVYGLPVTIHTIDGSPVVIPQCPHTPDASQEDPCPAPSHSTTLTPSSPSTGTVARVSPSASAPQS